MATLESILESNLADVAKGDHPIDVLVVGSGAAGVTSAIHLARQGKRVVILEAGPFLLTSHVGSTPFRSREDLVPQIHQKVVYRSSWKTAGDLEALGDEEAPGNNNAWSLVGGRTVFWGGCTPRFTSWDFDDWPISLGDLEPYYEQVEAMMHVSGQPGSDQPAFFQSKSQDELIDKLNAANIAARRATLGVDTNEVRNGHISRGFDSSVARLLRSGNLVPWGEKAGIALVAQAEALRLIKGDGAIEGVEVLDHRTGDTHTLKASQVVLAGSALQSTRLAMVSELDDPSGMMGHCINDHLFVQGVMKLDKPLEEGPLYIFLEPTPERPYHVQLQGPFNETWYSPYHATVWLEPDPDGVYVLFYVFGIGTVEHSNRLELRKRESGGSVMNDYVVVYDRSEQDIEVLQQMRDCMPAAAKVMGAEVVKDQINNPGEALHEIGGLRMGTTESEGVTDIHGKFWRYDNLWAADASSWPSQGTANSYLTIAALALRQAEKVNDVMGGSGA